MNTMDGLRTAGQADAAAPALTLRTHVEFRSHAFPADSAEEAAGRVEGYGVALADYLRGQLSKRGLVGGAPVAHNWGYRVPIDDASLNVSVICGAYAERPDGFLCFVEASARPLARLLRTIDTRPRTEEIADALDRILRAHPGVLDVSWWSDRP